MVKQTESRRRNAAAIFVLFVVQEKIINKNLLIINKFLWKNEKYLYIIVTDKR